MYLINIAIIKKFNNKILQINLETDDKKPREINQLC